MIVLTTHVLMVHRAWMESIAIGVTAQQVSLDRIVKRVGVPQRIFASTSTLQHHENSLIIPL